MAAVGMEVGETAFQVFLMIQSERLLARSIAQRSTAMARSAAAKAIQQKAAAALAKNIAKQTATKAAGGVTAAIGAIGLGLDIWDPLDLAMPMDNSLLKELWEARRDATVDAFSKIRVCTGQGFTESKAGSATEPEIMCPAGPGSCVAVYSTTAPPEGATCFGIPTPSVLTPIMPQYNVDLPPELAALDDKVLLHKYVDDTRTTLFESARHQVEYDATFKAALVQQWKAAGSPNPAPPTDAAATTATPSSSEVPPPRPKPAAAEPGAAPNTAAMAAALGLLAFVVYTSQRK